MTSLTPPLLAAMSGANPRLRGERIPVPKELELHMPVAKLLREHCLPDWRWTHFPAGEKRPVRAATKLKQMGLKRGWPDFLLFAPYDSRQIHGLELKRLGAELTEEQEEFGAWLTDHYGKYAVCWTLDQVLWTFEQWGCLRIKYTARAAE
jgi:hypothetical protein